jgi:hypothetical protein
MSKTKEAIIERLHTERRRLEQKLAGLSPEEMTQPGVVGDWSVKDVLAHLADWEQMCLGWCAACDRGEKPETPAPGHYSFTGALPAMDGPLPAIMPNGER